MANPCQLLYCHCAYAKVVPREVKQEVLKQLSESGVAFDAVADLCEMSARQDPALLQIAQQENVRIAACYPRAVKWLFAAAEAPIQEQTHRVLNMRTESAAEIVSRLLSTEEITSSNEDMAAVEETPIEETQVEEP